MKNQWIMMIVGILCATTLIGCPTSTTEKTVAPEQQHEELSAEEQESLYFPEDHEAADALFTETSPSVTDEELKELQAEVLRKELEALNREARDAEAARRQQKQDEAAWRVQDLKNRLR